MKPVGNMQQYFYHKAGANDEDALIIGLMNPPYLLHFAPFNLLDEILKKIEIGENITTTWKSILNIVEMQSLVVKCCKL